jgi:molybdopterin synthase catalytic subunit
MISLASEGIDPSSLLTEFLAQADGAGGIASFTGVVRRENDGEPVGALWLDFHERMTRLALEQIAAEARVRFALLGIAIVHRVGEVRPGEPIVFVAAAAAHRRPAFDAVDYAMDRVKSDAPFWKRETRAGRDHWIEARRSDRTDRARWEEKG